jgi:hypothetical protein
MLRQQFQNLISNSESDEEAAQLFCIFFNERIRADGWFDGDEWWENLTGEEYSQLAKKMENATFKPKDNQTYELINQWLKGEDSLESINLIVQEVQAVYPGLSTINEDLIIKCKDLLRRMFEGIDIVSPVGVQEICKCVQYLQSEDRSDERDLMMVTIAQVRAKEQ